MALLTDVIKVLKILLGKIALRDLHLVNKSRLATD